MQIYANNLYQSTVSLSWVFALVSLKCGSCSTLCQLRNNGLTHINYLLADKSPFAQKSSRWTFRTQTFQICNMEFEFVAYIMFFFYHKSFVSCIVLFFYGNASPCTAWSIFSRDNHETKAVDTHVFLELRIGAFRYIICLTQKHSKGSRDHFDNFNWRSQVT